MNSSSTLYFSPLLEAMDTVYRKKKNIHRMVLPK